MRTKTIPLSYAEIGMCLAGEIIDAAGRPLGLNGKFLTPTMIEKLESLRIKGVDIVIEQNPKTASERKELLEMRAKAAASQLEKVLRVVRLGGELDAFELEQVVAPIIFGEEHDFIILELMNSVHDSRNYLFNHGVAVAALAGIVADWLGLENISVLELALAGYLQDIGEAKIPAEILNKPSHLDSGEWESIREHPEHAYEVLKSTPGISDRTAVAVHEHHEREDASGYPRGLSGRNISLFGKILAACDTFHAMISKTVYKGALSPLLALQELEQLYPTKLDARPVKGLIAGMLSLYRGQRVRLNNGEIGKIVYVDTEDPSRPIVTTKEGPIDLTTRGDLYVGELIP